jgi:hypothetical protein
MKEKTQGSSNFKVKSYKGLGGLNIYLIEAGIGTYDDA